MAEIVAGRYELVDVLDRGGVGTVWRAWDHRISEFVAAKVVRASDSDALIRFVREAKRVVTHPHVLAPRSWTGEDDWVLFTMDLVRGGSVATLIGDFGALPEGWVVELGRQTSEALAAVHAAGFAHRDVKPANLLLDATGCEQPHLRLSDFGTAASFDAPRLTVDSAVLGTPGYLSPEARRGADPAPAQDVYALGVAMSHMLAGSMTDPRHLGDGITVELAALVTAMTDADPSRRPRSAREVVERLHELPGAGRLWMGADPTVAVEVFDHVPPLPAGWSAAGRREQPEGPVAMAPRPAPSSPPTGPVSTAPAPAAPDAPTITLPRADAGAGPRPEGRGQLAAVLLLGLLGVALIVASVFVA